MEFYALDGRGRPKRLATLERRPGSGAGDGKDGYTVKCDSEYFSAESGGGCRDGYRFGIEGGRLVFRTTGRSPGEGFYLDEFGVKPIATAAGGIRPGDDFLLRFGLRDQPAVSGTAKAADFLAVYDHKLLWRANLYLDEGDEDWNDAHPWVEGNEWNTPPAGYNGVLGGQVLTPVDTTWPSDAYNFKVKRSVAYSIACHDSPKEFNDKLNEQRKILDYRIKQGEDGFTADSRGWVKYTAPPSKTAANSGGSGVWTNYASTTVTTPTVAQEVKDSKPYRPAYASVRYAQNNNATEEDVAHSAGVDCVGLVQRAASDASEYALPSITGYNWSTVTPSAGRVYIVAEEHASDPVVTEKYLWKITAKEMGVYDPDTGSTVYPNLEKIIPGDIVYYWNDKWYHVMMVASVEKNAQGSIDPAGITLIEAVSGSYSEKNVNYELRAATNVRSLSWSFLMDRNWIIGRLMQ